jgi:GT2 family glycosyltransferase
MVTSPRFSIITPVYNPPHDAFEKCIESVYAQEFSDWQWCLVDDKSTDPYVATRLKQLQVSDSRVVVYFRSENGGIIEASNDALSLATGEFVVLLDNDDELHAEALTAVADEIAKNSFVDYIYTDEDKITVDGEHYDEFKKPKWSPERLLAHNYCSHLSVIRRDLVNKVGRFRKGFEGSQDYDLILRVTEKTSQISHIPKVLYHWRSVPGSVSIAAREKPYAFVSAKKAVTEHLQRNNVDAKVDEVEPYSLIRVSRDLKNLPKISIVIPTCGTRKPLFGVDTSLVINAVESIERKTSYQNFEIIVVVDTSTPEEVCNELKRVSPSRLKVIEYDKPFNFSDKCNLGVVKSDAPFFVLLNDDTEVISHDWLETMLSYLQEPDVAMVGPMLLLEDGRIQSAGHSHTPHPHNFYNGRSSNELGELGILKVARECSGVTGACVMVRRNAYFEVGGLSNTFPLSFNDVDLSFKFLDRGYRIIWTPFARLFHFETASRPNISTPEEIERITSRWGNRIYTDEYCRIQ